LPEHAERINAHAATQIRLTADSSFRITSGDLYGQSYFFGSIERLAFEAVMEVNLTRQAEFDEDTSLFFNPRRQQWWLWTVEDELKQTGPTSR